MSEFKIEKGIPFHAARSKYPFADMEVGDSFSFHPDSAFLVNSAAGAYSRKYAGIKFSVKKQSETESRIWRIS